MTCVCGKELIGGPMWDKTYYIVDPETNVKVMTDGICVHGKHIITNKRKYAEMVKDNDERSLL